MSGYVGVSPYANPARSKRLGHSFVPREEQSFMSKDFELLRRLEEERRKPPSSSTSEEPPPDCDPATLEALNSLITPVRSRAELLPAFTRKQLESMLRKTFPTASPRVLVFCGVDSDSDTGLITACAAELLSKTATGPVCVFDVSREGDCVSDLFELQKPANVSGEALLYSRIDENLWIARQANSGLSASLGPPANLEDWITDLRNNFSYVLVHADPVALSPETGVVGRLSDGLVLVIEAESTDRELTKQVKTELENTNVQILGAVLNKIRDQIPRRINDWLKAS